MATTSWVRVKCPLLGLPNTDESVDTAVDKGRLETKEDEETIT